MQMTEEIHAERAVPTGHQADASLEELLTFERLLFDLSARFANVAGEQLVAEFENALKQLLKFLGFDRGTFTEYTEDGKQEVLCSVAVAGVDPFLPGPAPAHQSWFTKELSSGRTIVIRSYEEFPPEAPATAEYYRRIGMRYILAIPLSVSGRFVASIGFASFRSTREWPDEFIARVKVIGEVMAQALIRKRVQDAAEATRAELSRAGRINRFGTMTASIAHEINQPLAAIAANTQAALRWLANTTPNLDEARAALERISRDSQRAVDVVVGLRAMFKNDRQNRILLDINQLVREVLVLVQGELFKRRISLETELTENLAQVMADRVQLQQVVMNLVTNAMDAMDPIADRPKLLRVKSANLDGDIVAVAIEDSGTGIEAGKVDRLFDAFFTTKPNGMGMGLSICRSIIEAHNGRLGVSAGARYGSVFQFELPTK